MDSDNLFKVANSFTNFLWIIHTSVFSEQDLTKNFQSKPHNRNKCDFDFSLPPSHVRVIFYLVNFNSSPISQIAENLNISKPNMTPIIDNLINHKLVRRYTDVNDRRIIRVKLTSKAMELLNSIRIYMCNLFADKISSLSDEEITALYKSISNLTNIMQKLK